jgi:multidrug efflux system outer membrane protein
VRARGWGVFLMLALAGCATAKSRSAPPLAVPTAWQDGRGEGPAPDLKWFQAFGTSALDALVGEALRSSADLEAAEARIRQAEARARAAGSALLPTVSASASATRVSGSAGGVSATETDRGLQFAASYELDFWGASRAARKAAREDVRLSRAEASALRLSLEASIAETYIDILDLRSRQTSTHRQIALLADGLAALEARHRAGLASAVEVSQYRASLAVTHAALSPLHQQEIEASAALALLVGRNEPLVLQSAPVLRDLAIPPPAGAKPAELLTRRPDVAAAEAALAAAEANVVAARAALFPRITLDAVAAHQNPGFQAALTTLSGTGQSLSLGATLLQTLWDGGKLQALRDEAKARREELLAGYRKAILAALLDAQRAFAVQQDLQGQQSDADVAERSAATMEQALRARRVAGLGDRLAAIDAERLWWMAQDESDRVRAQQLKAAVGVFKALGGGWRNEAE